MLTDINEQRLSFAKRLYPQSTTIQGDINLIKDEIVAGIKELVGSSEFLLSMTPPCQGMSQNGIKTIHKAIQEGKRPNVDERNYLLISGLDVISATKPSYVFFENVPQVHSTYILVDDQEITIREYLMSRMEELGYQGVGSSINFADYGVPQTRKRYVAIFTNKMIDPARLFPIESLRRVSMGQALQGLPYLDAINDDKARAESFHPLHKVPVMRPSLYSWVSNTREGKSAFQNNTCVSCSFVNGLSDVICKNCGTILPKPHVIRDGKPVLIKGYISTYKRQRLDYPASTVTTRSAFASSSTNLHPIENRVLSAYECAILQGIDPNEIDWRNPITDEAYPDYLVRELIGEAIPATFTLEVGSRILRPQVFPDTSRRTQVELFK